MLNYIVTIKTSKNETIAIPLSGKNEKDVKAQADIFFENNYKAPDRLSYIVKDVELAD